MSPSPSLSTPELVHLILRRAVERRLQIPLSGGDIEFVAAVLERTQGAEDAIQTLSPGGEGVEFGAGHTLNSCFRISSIRRIASSRVMFRCSYLAA